MSDIEAKVSFLSDVVADLDENGPEPVDSSGPAPEVELFDADAPSGSPVPDLYDGEMAFEDVVAHLGDRKWRLNNLYFVKDENGHKTLFKMRPWQEFLLDNLWYWNIVPKARQLGITTFFAVLYLDAILFSEDKEATIIVHKIEDQKKIFHNKIKYAWAHMHPWVRHYVGEPQTNNAFELKFPNGGIISTTMSNRGGTVQYLHISEFGYICAHDPEKAEEIVTGALQTVHAGNVVSIESTAAGAEGYFYDYCSEAKRMQDARRPLSSQDFKLFFFPWHMDPKYRLDDPNVVIPVEDEEYFLRIRRTDGVILDHQQKCWWTKRRSKLKGKMFAEFPSTFDECFMTAIEGAYYTKEVERMNETGRYRPVLYDPKYEVDTWWDLGVNDLMIVLLTQTIGDEIRFVDMYWNNNQPLEHYYRWLEERRDKVGYRYGRNHLPHDGDTKELQTNISRKQALQNLGMRNIVVGPKLAVKEGIDKVKEIFFRFVIDEVRCGELYKTLSAYRRDFDKKLGVLRDEPRHDRNSHFADAVRLLALLWRPRLQPLLNGEDDQRDSGDQCFFGGLGGS